MDWVRSRPLGTAATRGWRRWLTAGLAAGLAAGLLVSCGDDRDAGRSEPSVMIPKGKSARERQEQARKDWAELTQGAPSRVVWVADPSMEESDTFADSERLQLLGWDVREAGPRPLVAEAGNFGRPLITPDGGQVVFTEKRVQRRDKTRHFRPRMRVVEWETGRTRTLGKGFAVAVWADPATGQTWVYALEQVHPAKQLSIAGSSLVRFPLDAPDQREPVWSRTRLSVDSVHLSRDGQRFAALFPWPDAGIAEVKTGQWTKLDVGCWPALAPDDSQLAWVFDGPHRNLRMVAPEPDRRWSVNLSSAPDLRGKEAYHPRWSNHPQFLTFTGPYTKKKKGSRNAISSGGLTAEVHVGKFSTDLRRVESTVRLTHNKNGDFYPDLWVGGSEKATLAGFPQHPASTETAAIGWPPSPESLVFMWRDLRASNEVPGSDGRPACRLEARSIGRFTPHLGALLDGGWFEADADSNAAVATAVRSGQGVTLQALITEWPAANGNAPVPLLAWLKSDGTSHFALHRAGSGFELAIGQGASLTRAAIPHPLVAGQATAVAVVWHGDSLRVAINGRWIAESMAVPASLAGSWPDGRLVLGHPSPPPASIGARASIDRLTIHARPLDISEIAERAAVDQAAADARSHPSRLRVRARVLEATEPDINSMDTYHRLLVDHTYEILEVLEGSVDAKKIGVLHWAVLDDRAVPGFPRPLGREVELDLEPHDAHPELQGELTDLGSDEFGLPLFIDVSTPERDSRDSRD